MNFHLEPWVYHPVTGCLIAYLLVGTLLALLGSKWDDTHGRRWDWSHAVLVVLLWPLVVWYAAQGDNKDDDGGGYA